jgi:uncharacterized protein (TIGR04255 family)
MPIPESPRVIYATNPLDEVICQLRFPPVLRIDSEIPAAFQESVRREYPLFREEHSIQAVGIPANLSQLFGAVTPFGGRKSYGFLSTDEIWQVTLTRDFIALTCKENYRRWEEFKAHFDVPLRAFVQHYEPAFYTRVGLRYRNVIVRSKLQLENVSWNELLQPYIAGELGSELAPSIEEITQQLSLRLDEFEGKVTIQHGTAKVKDTGEECYYIDADFYAERRVEIGEVERIFNYFNHQSGRLFRWCITTRLHEAMEPAAVC